MKNLFLFSLLFLPACMALPGTTDPPGLGLELLEKTLEETQSSNSDTVENDSGPTKENFVHIPPILLQPIKFYPPGPYLVEKFHVMPNMEFYDPWEDRWIELKDFYLSKDIKVLLIVSSAGWCGPCLIEAGALIELYEKYNQDGLEIIYTLGNTNIPGDTPFDTTYQDPASSGFASDLYFMNNWIHMTQTEANRPLNYSMYADPKREFLPYAPNHAWPFSMLVTTKDMGVRLVEEGYWPTLIKNKIEMILYNEVPNIPFD